jgi:hypothetical protein
MNLWLYSEVVTGAFTSYYTLEGSKKCKNH